MFHTGSELSTPENIIARPALLVFALRCEGLFLLEPEYSKGLLYDTLIGSTSTHSSPNPQPFECSGISLLLGNTQNLSQRWTCSTTFSIFCGTSNVQIPASRRPNLLCGWLWSCDLTKGLFSRTRVSCTLKV